MSKQYSPKHFFRRVPNVLLAQYFSSSGVLGDLDLVDLSETNIDPIYDSWLQLPEATRFKMEQDFQNIFALSSEAGTKAILAEAHWHGEKDLGELLADQKGFHEKAFWTFLERRVYMEGALAFNHSDKIPGNFWRKRKNIPKVSARVDDKSVAEFAKRLGRYFYLMQGRGQNC